MIKSGFKYLLLFLPIFSFGQNKTYLGLEFGPKYELYRHADNGNGLYTKPFFISPIYGLTLGQEISNIFTLETGFYINDYGESYRIEGEGIGYSITNAIVAYQIPLRLKARLSLFKDKLNLVTTIGYTVAINNNYNSSAYGSSLSMNTSPQFNDSTRIEYTSNYSFEKTYGLIEAGLALDFKLKNSMRIYLAANYLTGLNKIIETDVSYWINDGPKQTGIVFSNGDYYSIVLGVKYPINNLWAKKTDK